MELRWGGLHTLKIDVEFIQLVIILKEVFTRQVDKICIYVLNTDVIRKQRKFSGIVYNIYVNTLYNTQREKTIRN